MRNSLILLIYRLDIQVRPKSHGSQTRRTSLLKPAFVQVDCSREGRDQPTIGSNRHDSNFPQTTPRCSMATTLSIRVLQPAKAGKELSL